MFGLTPWQVMRGAFVAKFIAPIERRFFEWLYRLAVWL
jgi:hypothetical protein